ncbi:signal recognition particle 9 kDa protein-domain-containing protein [Pyronema omphalodes]|nr:signal recognition particle 9 kDa protein-domain-containing protein [Pyronema omphalodes]
MKVTTTPQEFHTASSQLIRAYPKSTKITTHYHASTPNKGSLTLKTYDPVSGCVIKFSTSKIADVGRLITALHKLARETVGAPELVEEAEKMEVDTPAENTPVAPAAVAAATPAPVAKTQTQQTQQAPKKKGGKGKKK